MKHLDRRILDTDARLTEEIMVVSMNMSGMTQRIIRPVFDTAFCVALLLRVKLPVSGLVAMVGYGVFGVAVTALYSYTDVSAKRHNWPIVTSAHVTPHDR